jgi:hypothetical protein
MLLHTLMYFTPLIGQIVQKGEVLFRRNSQDLETANHYLAGLISPEKLQNQYQAIIERLQHCYQSDPRYRLKVIFLVSENQKWNCQSLYDELATNPHFEPLVVVSPLTSAKQSLEDNFRFFKAREVKTVKAYDRLSDTYPSLEKYQPDLVFYQQPWGLADLQNIPEVSRYALCGYIPYSFKLFDYDNNYLPSFHGLLWKCFLETDYHLKLFMKKYHCQNCVATGYPKLDAYLSPKPAKCIWKYPRTKTSKVKRIIYAPHHSITATPLALSTFNENSELILKLARGTPNTEWIFKPHPNLKYNYSHTYPEQKQWIDDYYQAWADLDNAQVYDQGDYFDIFKTSDFLITSSGSFLAEYLPTGKPVLHLRTKRQNIPFNQLGEKIIKSYYQIHNRRELTQYFKQVVIEEQDTLKSQRKQAVKWLGFNSKQSAAHNIIQFLEAQLLKTKI